MLEARRFGRCRGLVCAVVLVLLLSSAWLIAQQPSAPDPQQPTFRAGVELVTLHVTVLDRNRRPVRGLTAEDFTVLEGDQPRPIVAVDMIEVPTERPAEQPVWADEAPEDVVTNQVPTGRLVIIMFDRSIARGWVTERARIIAQEAIDALGPEDLAAVAYNYQLSTPLNFTADRKRLRDAIHSPVIGTQRYEIPGIGPAIDCPELLCGVELILRAARALQQADRRPKMLLYIGSDLRGLFLGEGDEGLRRQATREMFDAAQRAQLVIHAIDPEGLRAGNESPTLFSSETSISETLLQLASETGGRTVLNSNAPEERLAQVFQESEVSYLIGFTPTSSTNTRRATDERQVTVRVRGDDYTVRAPRSYRLEPPGATARSTREAAPPPALDPTRPVRTAAAIEGLSPMTEIDLRAAVVAVPDPGRPNRATVATVLGVRNLPATDGSAMLLRVEVNAFNPSGRLIASDAQTVTLTPRAGALTHTYDVLSHLTLPSGRYEIRAAVEQLETGRTGSVFSSVEIENFSQPSVAVSSLALHAAPAPRLIAAASSEGWFALPPTTERTFTRNRQVTAFLRLLQPRRLTPDIVELTTQIRDARGNVVGTMPTRIAPSDFDARRIANHQVALPLDQLTSGDYLLTVDVRHGQTQTQRTVKFRVE